MTHFPIDEPKWQQGVSLDAYLEGMKTYQEDMRRRLSEVQLTAADLAQLSSLPQGLKISALSEDWCIDCLMTLPIMNLLAEAVPGTELRIFSRGKWPELKEHYNSRGIMSLPVYSFLGADFGEKAVFIERPQSAHEKIAAWKAAHPEMEEVRRSFSLSSAEKSARLAKFKLELQAEMEAWYHDTCQAAMIAEICSALGSAS